MHVFNNRILWLIISLLAIVFLFLEVNRLGDFDIYYQAAADLYNEILIYDKLYGINGEFKYFGSPTLTILMMPWTILPKVLAASIWKILGLISLVRIWHLIERFLAPLNSGRNRDKWILITFLGMSFLLYTNFHQLQFTIILLYLCLEGMHQIIHEKRNWLGAFLIGLGVIAKIGPIVLLPYLIYRGHFKGFLWTIFSMCLLVALPSIVFGVGQGSEMWIGWGSQLNPLSDLNVFDMNNEKNQGLSAWLSTLFIEGIGHSKANREVSRHIADLSPDSVKIIILMARISLATMVLYFLRSLPFKKAQNDQYRFREISFLLLAIPLLFPQQRSYNFLFVMPAAAYLAYQLVFYKPIKKSFRIKWILFFIAMLILNLELLLGEFRPYYWHFKTLIYATFILLFLLVIMSPSTEGRAQSLD